MLSIFRAYASESLIEPVSLKTLLGIIGIGFNRSGVYTTACEGGEGLRAITAVGYGKQRLEILGIFIYSHILCMSVVVYPGLPSICLENVMFYETNVTLAN